MASKSEALHVLKKWGMTIDEDSSFLRKHNPFVVFDAPPNTSFGGDCRGCAEYSHDLPSLWDSVIERAESEGPLMCPCENPNC